jgi:hypothetical protein
MPGAAQSAGPTKEAKKTDQRAERAAAERKTKWHARFGAENPGGLLRKQNRFTEGNRGLGGQMKMPSGHAGTL